MRGQLRAVLFFVCFAFDVVKLVYGRKLILSLRSGGLAVTVLILETLSELWVFGFMYSDFVLVLLFLSYDPAVRRSWPRWLKKLRRWGRKWEKFLQRGYIHEFFSFFFLEVSFPESVGTSLQLRHHLAKRLAELRGSKDILGVTAGK